ncbi:MAG: hypothetical protein J6R59_09870 [Paludibacteraceae bacterium]|nr:hypothetical protein [Paludibacteraceae bacterium]
MEIKAIKIGDKFVVTKKVASFLDVDDIVKVIDVDEDGIISFAFGEEFMHKGVMNAAECEEYFEKIEEESAPSITPEYVEEIFAKSEIKTETVFGKCTIVSCKLPNGFVIVESSACVSPENYDEAMGIHICFDRIKNKIWELEGYRLQSEIYENDMEVNECCCGYCDECNNECCYDDCDDFDYDEFEDDDFDECLDTDLDCDDCDDIECPFHP